MNTEDKGKLKGKRKQNFDDTISDLYKHPEGNEGSSTNDGDGDIPQQIVEDYHHLHHHLIQS